MSIPILATTIALLAFCIVFYVFDYFKRRRDAIESYKSALKIIEFKKAMFLIECEKPLLILPREKKQEYGE